MKFQKLIVSLIVAVIISFTLNGFILKNESQKNTKMNVVQHKTTGKETTILPKKIKDTIEKKFGKNPIYLSITIIRKLKTTEYRVNIEEDDYNYEILFSKKGKIISLKKTIIYDPNQEDMGC